MISAEERQQMRALPGYRRAVWGLRMAMAGIPGLLLVAVTAGLGVPKSVGLPLAVVVIVTVFCGVFLFWSGAPAMNGFARTLAKRHNEDVYEMSADVRGVFFRDLFRSGGGA